MSSLMHVQLLGVEHMSCFPSAIVVCSETHRFLFDVGEGVQRLCVEHKVKLGRVSGVFLTNLTNRSVGGLPGLLLTLNDIGGATSNTQLVGPDALQAHLYSTRYFMRISKERFVVNNNQSRCQKTFTCDELTIHSIRLGFDLNGSTSPTNNKNNKVAGKFGVAKATELIM